MLFQSALRKELGRSFGATLVVLVTVVMTVLLIRTLGRATRGSVDPSEVMLVLGFTVIGYLPIILTVALFVAVVAVLTRMYSSSEMVVWFTCGQPLGRFVPPLLSFAAPVLAGIAVLALVTWPWSNQQIKQMTDRYTARGDLERVAPGQFQESAGGARVFFIDKASPSEQSGSNIFISDRSRGKESVVSARSGRVEPIRNDRFLVLNQGERLEMDPQTGESRLSKFQEYGVRIDDKVLASAATTRSMFLSTPALLNNPTPNNQAELSWRLGLVFAAFNCILLALAGTRVNPRVGRAAGLIFALLVFISYYNLINVGQSWVSNGRLRLVPFMVLLHGGIFVLAGGWLWLRQEDGLRAVLQRLRASGRTEPNA